MGTARHSCSGTGADGSSIPVLWPADKCGEAHAALKASALGWHPSCLLTFHWPKQVLQAHQTSEEVGRCLPTGRNKNQRTRTDLMTATLRYSSFRKVSPCGPSPNSYWGARRAAFVPLWHLTFPSSLTAAFPTLHCKYLFSGLSL